ncbi:MAG: exo-alpha-sialidase [Gammaproteobacteria bacterium]|nr:exo-alpha-sialidase [Gammaproteobacteria bacterium]
MKNKIVSAVGIVSLLLMAWQLFSQDSPGAFYHSSAAQLMAEEAAPFYQTDFASHQSTPEVHSATAIELDNNNIMAFWYGGTREGHKDVSIYQNTWNNTTRQWGQEKSLLSRAFTRNGTSRYIRKLGNPVVTRGPDHSIWLFYVSVSVGGWAGSAINLTQSHDEGQSWSAPKRLISTPFLNLSTLIKGTPIHYTDGTTGLPVYHELMGKFGELLKLNAEGEVIDKIRLSWGKTSLQPIIFPTSASKAVAMMRYQGAAPKRILTQTSNDSGLSWTAVEKSPLPNPGAGIIGLRLNQSKQLLLAFNNDEEEREDMSLAISSDAGNTWQLAGIVEENRLASPDKDKQFAYPWLLQTNNGNIHLLYTWHKSHIKHAVFNTAWLGEKPLARKKQGGTQ